MTTLTKEQFFEFRNKFKAEARAKSISAADLLLYNLIRNKNPKHGFTETTNATKIQNGRHKWQGYLDAVSQLKWSPGHYAKTIRMRFGDAVADYVATEVKEMRELAHGRTGITPPAPKAEPAPQPTPSLFSRIKSAIIN